MQMQSLIDFMISPRRHDSPCIHEVQWRMQMQSLIVLIWRMQMQSLIVLMNAIAFIDRFHDIAAAPRFSVYSWSAMKNANAIIDCVDECNCIHWSISWYRRGATILRVFSVYSWNRLKNANAIIDQFQECKCNHWSISWYRRGATIFGVFMK